MRSPLILLACLLAVVGSRADNQKYLKKVDGSFFDKQKKILDILTGISVDTLDSKYSHAHQDVPFNNPELYSDAKPLEKFMRGYKRGFLPRDEVFSLHSKIARHDTFNLFEIMYFAKDFDTFIQIAKWAKHELNPMQFSYAFTVAVTHRPDCRYIYLPPNYEMYPHFFVPSEVMRQADIASFHDVEHRVFKVNNTGKEFSWYRDMISGPSKSHPRWTGDDVESRISYFREDPGVGHFYSMNMINFATWLSPKKYPGINFSNRGLYLYAIHKWMLSRYNLERMSADLPFVIPFDSAKPVIGYNPRLSDSMGRPFLSRPDNMVPKKANHFGFWDAENTESRVHFAIDLKSHWDFRNYSNIEWENDAHGMDTLGKMMFGDRDIAGRYFYKPWYFLTIEAISDMIHSSNERSYTNNVFGKYMTMTRDPLFYRVLAGMDEWFELYASSLPPYTPQELNFPGVKVEKIEFDKLLTYFERWEYDITQGVPVRKPEDRDNRKYLVSDYRLNHKPFTFNVTVHSDKAQDSLIRIYFGPKHNMDNIEMPIQQARHAYFLAIGFRAKLKSGENVIFKRSDDILFETYEPLRSFKERMAKAEKDNEAFYTSSWLNCGFPSNLALPRGWGAGREYSVFVMAEPFKGTETEANPFVCEHNVHSRQTQMNYPFDRSIPFPNTFVQPNMLFSDVKIYHKFESDLNRPYST